MYIVYEHRHKNNGKRYIGQTLHQDNPNYRWNDGKGYVPCTRFYEEITKDGWDSFEHTVLFSDLNKRQADILEKTLIALYDTTNPEYGYNSTSGGDKGRKFSKEAKQNMIIAQNNRWKKIYASIYDNYKDEEDEDLEYMSKPSEPAVTRPIHFKKILKNNHRRF